MKPDLLWAAGLLAVAAAAGSPAARAGAADDAAFVQAMDAYERQHDGAAFQVLARLADAGHPEAARIALLMCVHGARLFRGTCTASDERRRAWLDTATTPAGVRQAAR